jgi:phosphoglycerate kinase
VEEESIDTAKSLMEKAKQAGARLLLPNDGIVAKEFSADSEYKTVAADAVPAGWRMLDIGPETVATFSDAATNAKTVIWNGPMGVFEMQPFAQGTRLIAQALANATAGGAFTIVGGGDSVAAVEQSGLAPKISHISTGGGASLELLEGRTLPGVDILNDK